jgi:hypothetical protein
MSDQDLDRVRADLAIMKNVCSEPAIPREEIGVSLIIAAFGAVLAVASWLVPVFWTRLAVALFGIVGTAIYLRWKLRIIKRDGPRRRMDAKELAAWTILGVGVAVYLLFRRFVFEPGEFTAERARQDAGAMLCFIGVAFLAVSTIHRTRRFYIPSAVAFIIGGIGFPFASNTAETLTIFGGTLFAGCLGAAIWMSALVRQERREHAGH